MGDQRDGGISWTDETWNPIRGCSRVSEGCRNCYAERVAARFSGPGMPYADVITNGKWNGNILALTDATDPGHPLTKPWRWQRPRRVFVNSMSDLFHEQLPFQEVDKIVAVMALAHQHQFQVLTKRPDRMAEYLELFGAKNSLRTRTTNQATVRHPIETNKGAIVAWPLPNVWWGMSAENQATFDDRIESLMDCRDHAAGLWISAEPLLGPIDLRQVRNGEWDMVERRDHHAIADLGRIDWMVIGGESGPGARPMNPAWARQLRDDCAAAGIPFHFKQWGEWLPTGQRNAVGNPPGIPASGDRQHLIAGGGRFVRVGKKAAGRLLDGVIHDEMPDMPVGR